MLCLVTIKYFLFSIGYIFDILTTTAATSTINTTATTANITTTIIITITIIIIIRRYHHTFIHRYICLQINMILIIEYFG